MQHCKCVPQLKVMQSMEREGIPTNQDILALDCSAIPSDFSSNAVLETRILLDTLKVHEHWWLQQDTLGKKWFKNHYTVPLTHWQIFGSNPNVNIIKRGELSKTFFCWKYKLGKVSHSSTTKSIKRIKGCKSKRFAPIEHNLRSTLQKWTIPGLFFFIFVFSTQLTVNKCSIEI